MRLLKIVRRQQTAHQTGRRGRAKTNTAVNVIAIKDKTHTWRSLKTHIGRLNAVVLSRRAEPTGASGRERSAVPVRFATLYVPA